MMTYLSLAAAARELGVTAATLRQQIAAGRLRAERIGPIWAIRRPELDRYRATSLGRPGRKARRPRSAFDGVPADVLDRVADELP